LAVRHVVPPFTSEQSSTSKHARARTISEAVFEASLENITAGVSNFSSAMPLVFLECSNELIYLLELNWLQLGQYFFDERFIGPINSIFESIRYLQRIFDFKRWVSPMTLVKGQLSIGHLLPPRFFWG